MSTMMEPDLTQHASVCENCGGVVVEHGRSWIHADGFYGCGPGTDSTSYALGLEHFEPGEWHEKSYEAGHADGYEAGKDDERDEHYGEEFTQDDLDEAQAEARGEALEDALREVQALVDAHNNGRR